jgi:hypothetical protein
MARIMARRAAGGAPFVGALWVYRFAAAITRVVHAPLRVHPLARPIRRDFRPLARRAFSGDHAKFARRGRHS